jgi:hypothetical protein
MGAALAIPLVLIVLALAGYLLWTLYAAGRGAATIARSATGHDSGETAAHSEERTKLRDVDTTPPPDPHD